jgi:uncharacterized protein YggE
MRNLIFTLLIVASAQAADLDNNTITVTATRTMNTTAPDQAWILVQLITPRDTGLDVVLAKLQGIGLGATDLASVFTSTVTNLQWNFTKATPLTAIKSTLASLTRLQSSVGAEVLNFSITGVQRSAAALAAQPCPLPALVSDARKQAEALAAAAGLRVGAIVSVSDQSASATVTVYDVSLAVLVPASFLFVAPYVSAPAKYSCALTVQFKLF